MIQALLILAAVLCGAVLTVQVGVNVELRNSVGHPISSTLLSFLAGTVGLSVYALVVRAPMVQPAVLAQIPAWQWTGGVLGAVYVVTTIILGAQLGAATLLSLVVAGQILAAMILDHLGLLGFAQHAINVWRVLGAVLLIAGTVIILRN